MRYNEAAFIGQKNSKEAQITLFNYTGFAMLTYTIKKSEDGKGFLPVGEKIFVGKSPIYENQIILYITDEEGYAKAQSKPLDIDEAERLYNKMINDGIEIYPGEIKTI